MKRSLVSLVVATALLLTFLLTNPFGLPPFFLAILVITMSSAFNVGLFLGFVDGQVGGCECCVVGSGF